MQYLYDFYGVEKKFEIEIIDGIDFKVKKYFDIPINNWKLENLAPSITRATKLCLDSYQAKTKKFNRYKLFSHHNCNDL